ncbi:MAG TPA: hypothetical protein VHS31_17855, partial [Tepidisphaeraceae bacterium]|nr:hypothetical protein [Tepidisphaeraceae bacterium]
WQQYQVDREGNVLHIVWSLEPGGERSVTITDVADRPLKKYQGLDIDDPAGADQLVRLSVTLFDDHVNDGWTKVLVGNEYRSASLGTTRLRTVSPPNVRVRSLCLFDRQKRIIDLYDPVTHALEGTIGPAGFARAQVPNPAFADLPANPFSQGGTRTLAFPSIVYWMELQQRQIKPIFTATADDPVISASELPPQNDPTVIVATHKQLYLIRPNGEVILSIPLPGDPGKDYFQPAILPANHHLLLYVGSTPTYAGTADARNEYLEFAMDGQLLRRTPMPQPPSLNNAKKPETALFGAVYPVALSAIIPNWVIDNIFDLRTEEYRKLFHGFLFGSAAICGIITILLGMRMGFGLARIVGWTSANILLGPSGVIAMLGLNEWPARERCPACNGKRFLARRECPRCAVVPPPPKMDGREIFEPCDSLQPSM